MRRKIVSRVVRQAIVMAMAGMLAAATPLIVFAEESTENSGGESGSESGSGESGSGSESSGSSESGESESSGEMAAAPRAAAPSVASHTETTNADGSTTIEHHEEVSATPEAVASTVADKTAEQETIKADVEGRGGTYNYTVDAQEQSEQRSESFEDPGDAQNRAAQTGGEISEVPTTEYGTEISEPIAGIEIDGFVERVAADHEEIVEVTMEEAGTIEVSGVHAEQTDFDDGVNISMRTEADHVVRDGYHIDRNADGSFLITITGGLEVIEIDMSFLSATLLPGDKLSCPVRIVNASGDQYEITGYNKTAEGPFRYVATAAFKDEKGTKEGELNGGAYTYYTPTDEDLFATANINEYCGVTKWKAAKQGVVLSQLTRTERNAFVKGITKEDLLAYYNEELGANYVSLVEAWQANFDDILWKITVNNETDDDFFANAQLDENGELVMNFTGSLDGPKTDNLYQRTVWGYIHQLILTVPKEELQLYKVIVDYADTTYEYQVTYNEVTGYNVVIAGAGEIAAPNEIVIPPEETPTAPTGGGGGGGGGRTTSPAATTVIADEPTALAAGLSIPPTEDSILLDGQVPLANRMIEDEDTPLMDKLPQTDDATIPVTPIAMAGLAMIGAAFVCKSKQEQEP